MTSEEEIIDWTTFKDPDEMEGLEFRIRGHDLTGVIRCPVPGWFTDLRCYGWLWVRVDGAYFDTVYHCEHLTIYNRRRYGDPEAQKGARS